MRAEPKIHKLKTLTQYFAPLREGRKRFEVRKNDRDFQVGDLLHLRGWVPGAGWTFDHLMARVDYIPALAEPRGRRRGLRGHVDHRAVAAAVIDLFPNADRNYCQWSVKTLRGTGRQQCASKPSFWITIEGKRVGLCGTHKRKHDRAGH